MAVWTSSLRVAMFAAARCLPLEPWKFLKRKNTHEELLAQRFFM
jgi:hypothetical protein